MDEVFAEFVAPLLGHCHSLLGLKVEGNHHRTALGEALITTHNTLVQSHTLVADARHVGHDDDVIRKAHLTIVVGVCRCGDDAQLVEDARDTQHLGVERRLTHIEVTLLPNVVDVHKRVHIRESLLHRSYDLLCHKSRGER